jgi:CRISPR type IV-associated protein Csf2
MNTRTIEITLHLTSPLHITSPEACSVDAKSMRRIFKGKGEVATAVMKQPVYLDAAETGDVHTSEESDEGKTKSSLSRFPIIPANTLRGGLRRAAARRIIDYLDATDQKISLATLHVLTCGAFSGKPEGELTLDDRDTQLANAYFAAFGGGPKLMRSGFQVATGMPITQSTLDAHLVPGSQQPHMSSQKAYELTSFLNMRRTDDVIEFNPDTINPKTIANYPAAVTDWIETITKNAADRKADRKNKDPKAEKTKKEALKSFTFLEIVNPGTRFYTDINFHPCLPDHAIGCILLALQDLLAKPLGGKSHNGFGRFTASATLNGQPILDKDGSLLTNHPELSPCLDAYNAWLADLKADDLEAFNG